MIPVHQNKLNCPTCGADCLRLVQAKPVNCIDSDLVSVGLVCDECGVSSAIVFHHFRGSTSISIERINDVSLLGASLDPAFLSGGSH